MRTSCCKSAVYSKNRIDPRTEPCGSPYTVPLTQSTWLLVNVQTDYVYSDRMLTSLNQAITDPPACSQPLKTARRDLHCQRQLTGQPVSIKMCSFIGMNANSMSEHDGFRGVRSSLCMLTMWQQAGLNLLRRKSFQQF